MPKRPKQHVIDDQAQDAFRALIPSEWIKNPLYPDYAKDYLVEVVASEDVSGKIFIVQLKGKLKSSARSRDATISVPIKRDHLRYYVQKLMLPVFVVAVDVTSKLGYFVFAQEEIDRNPALYGIANSGRATFHVPVNNRLEDTTLLLREIDRAWTYMRDRYPGSVEAAMKARKEFLEGLDKRIGVELSYSDGREHVKLLPKEPVEFTFSLKGDRDAAAAKLAAMTREGKPIRAEDDLKIEIKGSPLFSTFGGSVIEVSQRIAEPAEVVFYAESPRGRASLPEYRGELSGGTHLLEFDAFLPGCPCRIHLTLTRSEHDGCHVRLTWEWNPQAWALRPLHMLPWFERIHDFLTRLTEQAATLGLQVNVQGVEMFNGTLPGLELGKLADCAMYAQLLERARYVNRVLQLGADVPENWGEVDFQDIEELHALLTTGEYQFRKEWEFTGVGDPKLGELVSNNGSKGALTLQPGESTYHVLGKSIDFSEVRQEFHDWRSAKAEPVSHDGVERVQITLNGCTRKYVWPRYLKPQEHADAT